MRAWGWLWVGAWLAACAPGPGPVATAVRPTEHAAEPRAAPAQAAPAQASRFARAPEGERVLLLWTASVQGYVEPCGCTADPLGGVARLAAAVQEARQAFGGRVLLVDGGDLLFEHAGDAAPADRCQAEARADLLLDSYARAGLAATTLGPLDDVRGAAFRDLRLARAGIPTVGIGERRAVGEGARESSRLLLDAAGVKVGLTAFRVDDAARVASVRAALATQVQALKAEGARAVVALAQAPRELARAVVRGLPDLDAVLQGRAPGEQPVDPERLDGPVLLAAGMQAQHLGVLELVLDGRAAGAPLPLDDRAAVDGARRRLLELKERALTDEIGRTEDAARRAFLEERRGAVAAELGLLRARAAAGLAPLQGPHLRSGSLPLPRGSAEEPAAAAALAAYRARVPALVERCEAEAPCPSLPEGAPRYVGVKVCRACHSSAVDFWVEQSVQKPGKDEAGRPVMRQLGHAQAWQTLVDAGKEKDRSCVACHAVGFGEPGGPCRTSDVEKGGFAGVQCESCHGPGSSHAALGTREGIVRAPDEARCRSCHKVPHIETTASFVFEERRRLVVGRGHGLPVSAADAAKEQRP